jgi:hypothetical protein
MQSTIKVGDKVKNSYHNRTGVVVSIDADVTADYDLVNKQIVYMTHPEKMIAKVLCNVLTLDTLQPMTQQESFSVDDLEVL